jgi:hypothetical protein
MGTISSSVSIGRAGLASPPVTTQPTSGLRQMMDRFRGVRSEDAEGSPAVLDSDSRSSNTLVSNATRHVTTGSEDSAEAKFIAAGKAVGLNDEQLNEMLLANGMRQQSATTGSTRSGRSNANTSGLSLASPSPLTPHLFQEQVPMPASVPKSKDTDKGKVVDQETIGGIFRSLSRKKSEKALDTSRKPNSAATANSEARNKIVRRTLLLPEGVPITPQPYRSPNPTASPVVNLDSPTQISFGRKPSTRRKPVALTTEDERLVAGTVGGMGTSQSSVSTGRSVDAGSGGDEELVAGLGFLQPGTATLGERTSSGSRAGSLYDMYGDMGAETRGSEGGNKGIEIM